MPKLKPEEPIKPLVVSVKTAQRLLGVSHETIYQKIRRHELQSYLEGRSRRITMVSIESDIKRMLAEQSEGGR